MRGIFLLILMLFSPLSGCLETLEMPSEWEDCPPLEAGRASDDTLRILTYDIAAFSEEMFAAFTNQTGYGIEVIRADDAGGILETMLQTQQAPQADLAIGLDNTYLQTAIDFCLLQAHSENTTAVDSSALEPYDGP